MALEFQNISHSYSEEQVLAGINLTAEKGEVTCLLGPSGCGKTTLLRLAAGLMSVQSGVVMLDGDCLSKPGVHTPPEKRPVGLVFQEGALFPHMSVADNVAFGLETSASQKKARVSDLLPAVGLQGFEDRYPHTLSGGQQQRVALARALAPRPKVLLLDEPFANIDAQLRRDLREEMRRTLKQSGTAVLLVTHDPEEALEMGDQIAVMDRGGIVQMAPPQDLYGKPATAAVAKMFGRGQSLPATVSGGQVNTGFGAWPVTCLARQEEGADQVELVVRQDMFEVFPGTGSSKVIDVRSAGREQLLFVESENGSVLRIQVPAQQLVPSGSAVSIRPVEQSVFAYAQGD